MSRAKDMGGKLIRKLNNLPKKFFSLFKLRDKEESPQSEVNSEYDSQLTEWERKVLERKIKTTEAKKEWDKKRIESSRKSSEQIQNKETEEV